MKIIVKMRPVKLTLFVTLAAVCISCIYGATVLSVLVWGHQAAFYNGAGHMKDGTVIKASFEWGWFGRAVLVTIVKPTFEFLATFAIGMFTLKVLNAASEKKSRLPQQQPSFRWYQFRWHHKPQT